MRGINPLPTEPSTGAQREDEKLHSPVAPRETPLGYRGHALPLEKVKRAVLTVGSAGTEGSRLLSYLARVDTGILASLNERGQCPRMPTEEGVRRQHENTYGVHVNSKGPAKAYGSSHPNLNL